MREPEGGITGCKILCSGGDGSADGMGTRTLNTRGLRGGMHKEQEGTGILRCETGLKRVHNAATELDVSALRVAWGPPHMFIA